MLRCRRTCVVSLLCFGLAVPGWAWDKQAPRGAAKRVTEDADKPQLRFRESGPGWREAE